MNRFCTYLLRSAVLPALLSLAALPARAETNPRAYAVEVSATIQATPAQIALKWAPDANATGYNIYRKAPAATSWSFVTSVAGNATAWTDNNVANGGSYEYAITKSTSAGYQGTGYILAGINAPMVENRGKMILVVDSTHAGALATELARLQQDLVGDGWTVIRHDVSRNDTPANIKNLIRNTYNSDPANVKSVFLFGHVPVPYSGDFNPDGHPDHRGAWAADTYYGDMDGNWTDSTVNNTSASKPWNHNQPGDGKLDQSDLPSDLELAVGRVDLANMTCYANKSWSRSELDLLRAYLNKDHNFRHGRIQVPRRGLVCDNFGEREGEAFASTGWRSFAPFFGAENNVQVGYLQYFPTLKDNAYLWSYGTGGGSWYSCNGVGGSDDFANTEIKTVFTSFLGSYFGDWDNESAFLRAPLGSGWVLATAWGGRPHWFFHTMGLGETIGQAGKLSQNNRYGGLYGGQNYGTRQVHVTLLGDPSLRMHPVIPPASVSAGLGSGVTVNWTPSTDTAIQGYAVYRANSVDGPFTRISGNGLLNALSYTDASGTSANVYMVRAVKLEQSGSGTYLNPSQGIIATVGGSTTTPTPTPTPTPSPTLLPPTAPGGLTGAAQSSTQIRVQWNDNSANETGFRLLRKAGASGAYTTINLGANVTSYTDSGLSAGTQYFYKAQAYNGAGSSAFTAEINVSTPASTPSTPTTGATVTYLATDTTTRGAWKGIYGADGAVIHGDATVLPSGVTASLPGSGNAWVWQYNSTDGRTLQKVSGSSRIASTWYSSSSFEIRLNDSTSVARRLAVYCMDFDRAGRQQTVELFDLSSGQVLDSRPVSGFQEGKWLVYSIKGNVGIRARNTGPVNAVISGIFLDRTGVTNPAPAPTDSGTTTSPTQGPVRFLGVNTTTHGSWKGTFGAAGYQIAAERSALPSFVTVNASGKIDHVWNWSTTDTAALQKGGATDRLASCWYAASSFDLRMNFTDGQAHKVSFYCLDWDAANRSQKVEVIDATTGAVLHNTTLSSFQKGSYLSYDVKGSVVFRFTRTGPYNAVVSGIFFDAPSASL